MLSSSIKVSIVELDKYDGEELDILINNKLFGYGKLKVIEGYFGVKITKILDKLG